MERVEKQKVTTFADDIEEAAQGEPIRAVLVREWDDYSEEPSKPPSGLRKWEEVRSHL